MAESFFDEGRFRFRFFGGGSTQVMAFVGRDFTSAFFADFARFDSEFFSFAVIQLLM